MNFNKAAGDYTKVQYTNFAQNQKESDQEEETVRRLHGESNFDDKAPQMIQLTDNDEADQHFLSNIALQ